MLRRLFFTLSLLLLFGLAQQGAVTHAVSHLADWQTSQDEKSPGSHKSCEQCIVYAKFSAAGSTPEFSLAAEAFSRPGAPLTQQFAASLAAFPFQARGPPRLS